MRFSIQNLLSLREGQSHAQVYANTLDECKLAEELGFHAVWLAEHHFSVYGIAPSLPVLAAAVARETRRVCIGTAVVIAPFAHPVRIAEEWAMVDIFSNGRLEFGLGRGYQPAEFRGLSISMEKTRERFDESLELIRRAWTQERCTFEGEFYQVRDLRVLPKPVQKPHPPLWTAAVSPDTYTLAGKRGLKILTSPAFTPFDILRKNYDAYRQAWREAQYRAFYYRPYGPFAGRGSFGRPFLGWPYGPSSYPFGDPFLEETRLADFCMRAKGYELVPVEKDPAQKPPA